MKILNQRFTKLFSYKNYVIYMNVIIDVEE